VVRFFRQVTDDKHQHREGWHTKDGASDPNTHVADNGKKNNLFSLVQNIIKSHIFAFNIAIYQNSILKMRLSCLANFLHNGKNSIFRHTTWSARGPLMLKIPTEDVLSHPVENN
jgi:hypothetical protein